MFQFPRCPSCPYAFRTECHLITDGGFPHSDTPGSTPAYGSPRHFGVRPVLLRLLAPRHPPCALITLSYRRQIHVASRRHVPSLPRSRTGFVRSFSRSVRSSPCLCLFAFFAVRCAAISFVTFRRSLGYVPKTHAPSRSPSVPWISCASLALALYPLRSLVGDTGVTRPPMTRRAFLLSVLRLRLSRNSRKIKGP